MSEGSWVGLDVHARTTRAGVLDAASGVLSVHRVSPRSEEAVTWLRALPQPVRVAYEAGPTGYGLARACAEAGIACTVAAPSKIPRAPGDRVKTDRRDAERLARLLRMGELVPVRVPDLGEEAARDLVRAREDARGDLMRARHRLSKLLLRHGLLYEGSAWTLAHDAWPRRQRFPSGPLALTFDESYGAVVQGERTPRRPRPRDRRACRRATVRRRRLPARVPARRFHPDRARAHRRARRLGALSAAEPRPIPRTRAQREFLRRASSAGRDHEDRQHPCPSLARRGGLAPGPSAARERHPRATPPRAAGCSARARRCEHPTSACALARPRESRQAAHDRRRRGRPRARRSLLGTGDDEVARRLSGPARGAHRRKTRGAIRGTAMSSPPGDARL
jgi:hypothetical protein